MKPVYEIVRADELRVGDVVQWDGENCKIFGKIQEDDRGDIWFQFHRNGVYFCEKAYYRVELYRQLPPERNPDALELALELMITGGGDRKLYDSERQIIEQFKQQAIRELESEAGDGVQD